MELTNTPEYTVSDLSRAVKQTVESAFSYVRVRGELSRITIAKSGHLYSDLKDDSSVISVVCWKGTVQQLTLRPEEGMEVICTGRMTTFPGSSRYQLVIEGIELAGEGALLKLLEQRKAKLAAEGLFDEGKKKPLPFLPKTIGVVTSPTGAVIRDIIHRIRERFPCHIIVWPVQVQGQGSAEQIARGINGFNKVTSENRPDLIIVARGGGSLEDLMAFNEEIVVRAAAASEIPLISAVGHETDITLIDFASDKRAPTPTGAAEMAVPVRHQLAAQVMEDNTRLHQCLTRLVEQGRRHVEQLTRILANPLRMIEPMEQKFDTVTDKLNVSYSRLIDRQDRQLHGLSGRLQTPRTVVEGAGTSLSHAGIMLERNKKTLIDQKKQNLLNISSRLLSPKALIDKAEISLNHMQTRFTQTQGRVIQPREDKLQSLSRMLETLSYKSILNRGFAVLKDEKGKLLNQINDIEDAASVEATVKDGTVKLR